MDKEQILERIRTVLDGWPQTLDDLIVGEWDSTSDRHWEAIGWLAHIVRDDTIDQYERKWAYTCIETRIREIADEIQSGDAVYPEKIPPEIFAVSFQMISGMLKQPEQPRGRDKSVNALRNRKLIYLEGWLRDREGHTRASAVSLMAEATGMTEEGVDSALRRTHNLLRQSSYESYDDASSIWRAKMP